MGLKSHKPKNAPTSETHTISKRQTGRQTNMVELQRSVTSFRRQGSSGLVWDNKVISGLHGELSQARPNQQDNNEPRELRQSQDVGSISTLERSRSAGARPFRAVTVATASKDPPSPKVAKCGLCGLFRKPVSATHQSNSKSKSKKRR